MMWRKAGLLLLLLVSLLWCSPGICFGSPTGPGTLTISSEDWTALQRSNSEQRSALLTSQRELSEARQALAESQTALSEARALLETSGMELTEQQTRIIELLKESVMQKQEIERLKDELAEQKAKSYGAYEAIAKANQYLQDTRAEIRANEERHRKTEAAMKNRITAWQIIAVILAGVAVAK